MFNINGGGGDVQTGCTWLKMGTVAGHYPLNVGKLLSFLTLISFSLPLNYKFVEDPCSDSFFSSTES